MGECILVQDGAEFPYFHTVSNFELAGSLKHEDSYMIQNDQMRIYKTCTEMKVEMDLQTTQLMEAFEKLNDLIEKQSNEFSDSMALLKMSKSRICLKYLLLNRPKTWIPYFLE